MTTLSYTLETPTAPANSSESVAFSEDSYTRMLIGLLPKGKAFNTVAPTLYKTLQAIAVELARIDARAKQLIEESDPRTASETLAEWEQMLGLPDDRVLEIPATDDERRLAITQKYVSLSEGQNYDFFELLLASCGYTLEGINLFANSVLRAGFRVGDRVYGEGYAYSMEVEYTVGASVLDLATMKRVVQKATHSHIQVFFTEV